MTKSIEIVTERLQLRSISLDDAEAIFDYRSDVIENKYQGWIPSTINDVYAFINKKVSSTIDVADTWFQFVITIKGKNTIVGDIGVHFLDLDKKQVEIGCTLNKNFQHCGYATEALKELINYLFSVLNKHRVICSIDPANINSIRLVERLGLRKEAHFKKSILINGEWFDDLVYAILKDEWILNQAKPHI